MINKMDYGFFQVANDVSGIIEPIKSRVSSYIKNLIKPTTTI